MNRRRGPQPELTLAQLKALIVLGMCCRNGNQDWARASTESRASYPKWNLTVHSPSAAVLKNFGLAEWSWGYSKEDYGTNYRATDAGRERLKIEKRRRASDNGRYVQALREVGA